MKKFTRSIIQLATAIMFLSLTIVSAGCSLQASGEKQKPEKIRLDYAYYSPLSLVLKEKGWAEEEFKKEGIAVEYVLSQGSNKALEFLNSNSVDFGSTAGGAALIAKAKKAPIEGIYIASKPEWTALLTQKNSSIQNVEDLKGKKVAATLGTDPYIFLLRSLNEAEIKQEEVQIVNLQHSDGAAALTTGQVDAWAGLDPHMARIEVESGARLFYRNPDFNTYCFLNVRSDFAKKYPEQVEKVIALYEKARKWTLENPEEATKILAKAANLNEKIARIEMTRNDFTSPVPGDTQRSALREAAAVLQKANVIAPGVDTEKTIEELVNPSFAKKVVK